MIIQTQIYVKLQLKYPVFQVTWKLLKQKKMSAERVLQSHDHQEQQQQQRDYGFILT